MKLEDSSIRQFTNSYIQHNISSHKSAIFNDSYTKLFEYLHIYIYIYNIYTYITEYCSVVVVVNLTINNATSRFPEDKHQTKMRHCDIFQTSKQIETSSVTHMAEET